MKQWLIFSKINERAQNALIHLLWVVERPGSETCQQLRLNMSHLMDHLESDPQNQFQKVILRSLSINTHELVQYPLVYLQVCIVYSLRFQCSDPHEYHYIA
jgi:hypothetical protein